MKIIFDSKYQKEKIMDILRLEVCPSSLGLKNHCDELGGFDDCYKCLEREIEMSVKGEENG